MKAKLLPMTPATGHRDFSAFKLGSVISVRQGDVLTPCRPVDLVSTTRSRRRSEVRARRDEWGGLFYSHVILADRKPDDPDDNARRSWAAMAKRARKRWMGENPF